MFDKIIHRTITLIVICFLMFLCVSTGMTVGGYFNSSLLSSWVSSGLTLALFIFIGLASKDKTDS